jgi:hypothetical protein
MFGAIQHRHGKEMALDRRSIVWAIGPTLLPRPNATSIRSRMRRLRRDRHAGWCGAKPSGFAPPQLAA